ncbi:MAG TPA: hypothetical protein VFG10_10705 [Saprospiraceae bacterium]|nr:hypothetical protein [Saprospiraceae bacterium]
MFRWISFFVVAGIMMFAGYANAQRIGLLPPGVKWHQLRDDSIRIIFPEGEEVRAQRVASLMLRLAGTDPITTKGRYRPISVLLQPQTNISNGYVGLAPYVSEFYLQAHENPFALGSLPWEDLLSIHEYRHVQQVNTANRGISHLVKLIFGDLAFSGLYSLSVPNWYREGDAVYAETKWTLQGRGRLSSFVLPFHEKLLQGVTWDYYKLRNGSYREFTPDHYSLGYLLVQFGNHAFGEETWDTIIQEAPTFKYLIKPFSGSLQARYGKRSKFFYLDAMEWYAAKWEGDKEKDIVYPLISMEQKDMRNDYFDMSYPGVSEDGHIYTSVKTFDHTTAIFKIDPDGKKKKIVSMGLQQDPYFDQKNQRLTWTELRADPRWVRKDKNVIVVFDEKNGHQITIKPRKGYFTPSLDRLGERIAALHADGNGNYNIHILDARTGSLLATLPNKDNLYLEYPIWNDDEQSIIAIARDDQGRMAIVREDIATGDIRPITHYSFNILGRPYLHDDWIFLTTNLDTLDQVYAVDKNEGIFYRISKGSTAHYNPAWDPIHDAIVCSEYRLNGNKIIRLPAAPSRDWKLTGLNDGVKYVEGAASDLLAPLEEERKFEVKKYSPWSNAINVHSWTVVVDDPVWSAEIRSDNILNNISLAAGYEYDRNSKAKGPYADIRLGMWYPVISFGIGQTSRKVSNSEGMVFRESNNRFNVGLTLPLYFTIGPYQQVVNVSSTYNQGLSRLRPVDARFPDFPFNYVTNRIILINSRNQAYRQAMPSWGQRLDFTYSREVSGVPISLIYLSSDLAFPGVKPSHYFLMQGEYLSQDISKNSIQLSSPYRGARGYNELNGKNQYGVSVTYGFPIWYPDFGYGNIFYSRRVRLQPFFDIAHSEDEFDASRWMRSMGAELIVDFHFPPISVGIRYSRLLSGDQSSPNVFEFFIPVQRF